MNPYEVLGVDSGVSDQELSAAYKKLAKRYHPDLNPGNEAAARKMGEINQAYDQIKAMRQRGGQYDPYGRSAYQSYPYGQQTQGTDPFSGFHTAWKVYYRKPRRSIMGMILAAVVTVFLVRLLLGMLFGSYYYTYDGNILPYEYGTVPYGYSVPQYESNFDYNR